MLIVFLLLFSILCYTTAALAGTMFLWGARFLVRGLTSTTYHRWLHLLGAIALLPPPLYLCYLVDPAPFDRIVDGLRISRACFRYAEVELPVAPVLSRGVELTSSVKVTSSSEREIDDLVVDPFLYLGTKSNPGFHFVEVDGKRYTGTAESYVVTPYVTPTAPYRISLAYAHTDPRRFQLTVSERETHRRVGNITGFRNHLTSCPTYSSTRQMLRKVIAPSEALPLPAAPPSRVMARQIPPIDSDDQRRPHLSAVARFRQTCPILTSDAGMQWSSRLEFATPAGGRVAIPFDEAPHSLEYVGLLCTDHEIFTLLRGVHPSRDKSYFLYRHTTAGELVSRREIVQEANRSIDHESFRRSTGEMFIRDIRLPTTELIIELARQWYDGTVPGGRQASIGWYALPLVEPHADAPNPHSTDVLREASP